MPDVFKKPYPVHHPVGIFTSFCPNPDGVVFQSQEKDEIILLFLRRHFITNLPWILISSFFIALPLLFILFPSVLYDPFFSSFSHLSILFLIICYYLVVITYIFIKFITWFYNISLVTNKRVVDIDFSNLVYHNVSATKVQQIEDVTYLQVGFIHSLFNYGDMFIQTAGESENFDFLAIPNPAKAEEIILSLIGKKREF